jgi:hypothetical protein
LRGHRVLSPPPPFTGLMPWKRLLGGLWDGGRGSYLSSSPSSPRSGHIAALCLPLFSWRPGGGVSPAWRTPGLWDRRQVVLNRWPASATLARRSNLLELGSFWELLQSR